MIKLHIHIYKFHHTTGVNKYYQCKCGKRKVVCPPGVYQPIDKDFLNYARIKVKNLFSMSQFIEYCYSDSKAKVYNLEELGHHSVNYNQFLNQVINQPLIDSFVEVQETDDVIIYFTTGLMFNGKMCKTFHDLAIASNGELKLKRNPI